MKADYKNWVPNGMIYSFGAATAGLAAAAGIVKNKPISVLLSVGALGCGAWTVWCVYANGQFSYDGKRQLSRQIVEGTAEYITLPEGGVGLDVGCGSGALTIACAKRDSQGTMIGIDRWGAEYASFNKELCEKNAEAEGIRNIRFQKGGTFAIHDLMESARYGDMEKFAAELKAEGYEDVRLIKTTNGMFMSPGESKLMMLSGSTMLIGKK